VTPGESTAAVAALVVIMAAALAIRLWALGSVPQLFFHDECDNTVNAIEILQGKGSGFFGLDWKPQPALGVHQIALSLKLFGPSVTAIRLPSAVLSVVALLPFFLVARRVTGPVPALLSALLLACNLGYLHFSRTGWENVQVGLYTLIAIDAVHRAESRGNLLWWIVAGFAAAVGAYIYFGGRAIVAFLLAYAPLAFLRAQGARGRVALGTALLLLTFILCLAPLYPTLRNNWAGFNNRTRAVLITQELPPNATAADVARKLLMSGGTAARGLFDGRMSNQPRYHPMGRPFLDGLGNGLLFVGLVASLLRLRDTALWWLVLLIPFAMTQMLTTGAPNLARGIALLPIVYLFVALAMWALERLVGRWRRIVQVALVPVVIYSAGTNVRDYFKWADSYQLTGPLFPAVQLADFPAWWDFQNEWIRANRGFFNVDQWMARRAAEAAHAPTRQQTGTIYRGSTTVQPYEIDLGAITLHGGKLEVKIFSVPGSDCVYDYVEAIGPDGQKTRAEAEDPRYTVGDQPVPFHAVDNHWWLQDYGGFSGGQGLVALKNETPPALVTTLVLSPGTYEVHVGSFTGDPGNGPFAIQTGMSEVPPPGQGVAPSP